MQAQADNFAELLLQASPASLDSFEFFLVQRKRCLSPGLGK